MNITFEWLELAPVLTVLVAACVGVVVEALAPRASRFVLQVVVVALGLGGHWLRRFGPRALFADGVAASLSAALIGLLINLSAGVNERVGWLFYGNKMQRVGTYGSSSSSAYHKDDTHFSGNGVLRVLHDNSGTLITVK